MKVVRYSPEAAAAWDAFVETSRNGTFLFRRGYMDYHADRFEDHSLLVLDEKERPLALLPANINRDQLHSHGGLTYGGFIIDRRMTVQLMLEVFDASLQFLGDAGIARLLYKCVPHIYHEQPAEEDLYALYRLRARLVRRDHLAVIDYRDRYAMQERRARAVRKAARQGLEVRESHDFAPFWEVLTDNLQSRYGVKPVHTLAEITLLKSRFPDAIRLLCAFKGAEVRAGAVVYASRGVAHVQYNAASPAGKEEGALDVILDFLTGHYSSSKRYFDFGVSTEQQGMYLNTGLAEYKEGFGARTVVHDFYELDVTSYDTDSLRNVR